MTATPERFLGIDVAKHTLDVHVRPDRTVRQFANTPAGIAELAAWAATLGLTRLVLEASGGYEQAAVAVLSLQGLPLSVVNPKRVRDFAKARGQLAKTDALDAAVLAEFADRMRPPVRPLPDADAQKLQALLTRRHQLIGLRTMETNRRAAVTDRALRRSFDAVLQVLNAELAGADRDLAAAVHASPVWQAKDELLQSIPGIGPVVSRTLLASLPELGTLDREQVAALVGVAPVNRDSGQWRGRRAITGGRAVVRSMLYLASPAARQGNALLRAFADRLKAAGKAPKVIRVALARKLLVIANAVLRDQRPWQAKTA